MKAADGPEAPPAPDPRGTVVGLISDTHGLVRPQALEALRGVDLILHAGDVGTAEVLEALRSIAPVTAVRGNVDTGLWARSLARTVPVEIAGLLLYLVHDLGTLDLDPRAAGVSVVLYGHSHKPAIDQRQGILFVNPGSAGPRRFALPVSVGRLTVKGGKAEAEIVYLGAAGAAAPH